MRSSVLTTTSYGRSWATLHGSTSYCSTRRNATKGFGSRPYTCSSSRPSTTPIFYSMTIGFTGSRPLKSGSSPYLGIGGYYGAAALDRFTGEEREGFFTSACGWLASRVSFHFSLFSKYLCSRTNKSTNTRYLSSTTH